VEEGRIEARWNWKAEKGGTSPRRADPLSAKGERRVLSKPGSGLQRFEAESAGGSRKSLGKAIIEVFLV
jgi:hypothetical protein